MYFFYEKNHENSNQNLDVIIILKNVFFYRKKNHNNNELDLNKRSR